jgi:phage shock protein E
MYSLAYTCSGAEVYSLYAPRTSSTISKAHQLTGNRARRLIDKGYISKVIDVRGDTEWSQGHYTDAKHIPFHLITESALRKHEVKKDESVLIYCNTGHRAKHIADLLKTFGFKNVFYVASSYDTFESNLYQTSSSEKYALPLALVTTV